MLKFPCDVIDHSLLFRPGPGHGRAAAAASTTLLWVALLQASLRDTVEGHHYSVDMILVGGYLAVDFYLNIVRDTASDKPEGDKQW